jgi:predicted AlkP superfamily phosphohydrolase/phosphomutase
LKKKVIVIGLDGLEPSIAESMMERGELPSLAKLRREGFYGRLKTTYPAQTPVAWSSFATGTNPGAHGIFDFLRRDPQTYQIDFALSRFERPRNIFARPRVVNQRRGVPLWQLLTEAEIPSTVLRCPCTFPPDPILGTMLAGVGVPDLRGSQGKGTFYTQDPQVRTKEGEMVVHLDPGTDFQTRVTGPRTGRGIPNEFTACDIRATADLSARKLVIRTSKPPSTLEITEGGWSPWVRLSFKVSALQSISGIVRFHLRRLAPHVEFYASPVNFDPGAPLFPVSSPGNYASELAEKIGLFSTLGMAEDHAGLEEGRFDEAAFLAQCELVLAEREKMAFYELNRFKEGFFFVLFDTPDRVQHMFWRFRDPEHPRYDPERAREFGRSIEDHYRRYDVVLNRAMEAVDPDTLIIVLSDHGFSSFRRVFHINTWLLENGFLSFQKNKRPDGGEEEGFVAVDWTKTRAYALGFGGIYLNIKGRERDGIVEPGADAERVCRSIQKGLVGLADPATSRLAVSGVWRREEIYSGVYAADSPDLLLTCSPGFRASWQTALGGIPRELFGDNTRLWSGDHIIDPEEVPGVLFMNRPGRHDPASIVDLAPTILNYLGVPRHDSMEGHLLL